MLEIRDLHVQFHEADHEAVRGIDLTVGDGEIVGLVGESGSGKTVTAMMISGLLRPEQAAFRGQILLDGRDLLTSSGDTLRSIQGKDICVVFQEPMSAMDPTMRIGPQVEECLRVHTDLPPGKRRELALQALRDVDLPEAVQQVGHGLGLLHQLQKPGFLGLQRLNAALGRDVAQGDVLPAQVGGYHVGNAGHFLGEFVHPLGRDTDGETGAAVAAGGIHAAVIAVLVIPPRSRPDRRSFRSGLPSERPDLRSRRTYSQ